jgi:outer membrane protein OmpA-like peptidoglycan-associated protein
MDKTPIYRVNVVSRTAKAVNYRHRSGSTKVDFQGTALMPRANGEAKVESKQGYLEIDAKFKDMEAPSKYGPEYLTYVLWAVTPEGRPKNLGEVVLNGTTDSKLDVTTELQAFGLIVTAEPYFAVTMPSDVVVMENIIRKDTAGKIEEIDAKYELLPRGQYTMNISPTDLRAKIVPAKGRPWEVLQARNAVQIAQWSGADKYAGETYQKAAQLLDEAENYQLRKHPQKKPAAMIAREAVQTAEDARLIAIKRIEEERIAKERQAAADREAAAQAQAQQSAADAERTRREAELARAQAQAETERLKRQSAEERAKLEQARAEAEAQQRAAQTEAERSRLAADEANRLRAQSEQEKTALREQLRQQLNMILETRSTARGLIVNMSDVLFDTGKYTLRPGAREKLAKVSGILLAHPSLKIEVEGHTDSVGGDVYNQRLSEQRAAAVRDYLAQNGIAMNNLTAVGFGKAHPVASNSTAAGRQMNRRVELVVSGEEIGAGGPVSSVRP